MWLGKSHLRSAREVWFTMPWLFLWLSKRGHDDILLHLTCDITSWIGSCSYRKEGGCKIGKGALRDDPSLTIAAHRGALWPHFSIVPSWQNKSCTLRPCPRFGALTKQEDDWNPPSDSLRQPPYLCHRRLQDLAHVRAYVRINVLKKREEEGQKPRCDVIGSEFRSGCTLQIKVQESFIIIYKIRSSDECKSSWWRLGIDEESSFYTDCLNNF